MRIKLLSYGNLTQHDRKAIKAILSKGWLEGSTGKKSYYLFPVEGTSNYKVKVTENITNIFNRKDVDVTWFEIEIKQ